ncbi:MAG: phosphoglucosamine mutase [Euryarchaeota archaeon RBG_19FT_COMBO_69_17]|nr:MAG: phosphoglucosamine mutase [Euryarchaeota archaeon RBG_19FT_COMBO_69_17]
MPRFGSSGIRGLANVDVTPDLALRVGQVLGDLYGDVVVGRDPRTTSPMLACALLAGVLSSGGHGTDAGLVSTPTLARGVAGYGCGAMITASHNPAPYNGIKLWNPDGMAFDETQQGEVEAALDGGRFRRAAWDGVGRLQERHDLVERHTEAILKEVGTAKLRVVVDCGCGATATITPFLLRRMGCEVLAIHGQPDGRFPGRDPEPTEANLALLASTVRATGADLGVAHDGDGDRMVAVDRDGAFVGGDKLLALFAKREVRSGLVVSVDASMVLEDLLPKAKVWRTRVGDVYVAQEVKRRGADFGGEPSGTWIFPKASLCPDGVYAAARLVSLVAERPLAAYLREIPTYPIVRGSLPYPLDRWAAIQERLDAALRALPAQLDVVDGWRLRFEDGWALVRFSGTEPKIRLLAEARTEARAKEIYGTVLSSAQGAS